jgi:hypothetical protein
VQPAPVYIREIWQAGKDRCCCEVPTEAGQPPVAEADVVGSVHRDVLESSQLVAQHPCPG